MQKTTVASKMILEKVHSFEDIPKEVWIQFRDKAEYSAAEAELQSFLKDVPGTSAVVIYLKDVKAMKRLPAGFLCKSMKNRWMN